MNQVIRRTFQYGTGLFCLSAAVWCADSAGAAKATIAAGTPLEVSLEKKTPLRRVGEPLRARLTAPVYVYDREALPAGTILEGQIAEIGKISTARRLQALAGGKLTPPRTAKASFESMTLADGTRVPLSTEWTTGTAYVVPVSARRAKSAVGPSTATRLSNYLMRFVPYQRYSWRAGTSFAPVLRSNIEVSTATGAAPKLPAADSLDVRLAASLSSRDLKKGDKVTALVTKPLYGKDGALLAPEGSKVIGEVVQARPARWLRRNGKLQFMFNEVQPLNGPARNVRGYVEGMQADYAAGLSLDEEGETQVRNSSTRFIFPAIATTVAGLSLHQDIDSRGVPDADLAGRAEAGAVGLGLIGTVVAQTSRTVASTIAFSGAAMSIYSAVFARGRDVELPANTKMTVNLAARQSKKSVK